jgi:hypothetical protein
VTRPTIDDLRAKHGPQVPLARGHWSRRYAGEPGTGPAGATCHSCAFLTHTDPQGRGKHPKCGKFNYTHGDATTIKTRTAACHLYEKRAR